MQIGTAVIFAVMMLLYPYVGEAATQETVRAGGSLPEIKKNCTTCHPSADVKKGSVQLNKPIAELCIGCHPERKSPSEHKVDIAAKMEVKLLPLSDGKITCVTCHDPHQYPNPSMLRMTEPDLCMQCHKK